MQRILDLIEATLDTDVTPAERTAVPTLILGNEVLALAAFAGSSKYRDVFDVNLRMLSWLLETMPA